MQRRSFGSALRDLKWLGLSALGLVVIVFVLFMPGLFEETKQLWMMNNRGLAVLVGVALMVGLGLRMAGTVDRRREQKKLASLMTVSGLCPATLTSSWHRVQLRICRCLVGVAAVAVVAFALLGCPWQAWVLLPAALAAHALFAASLGRFLSVVSRSSTWAYIGFAVVLLTLFVGTWLVEHSNAPWGLTGTDVGITPSLRNEYYDYGKWAVTTADVLNPVRTWWQIINFPRHRYYSYYLLYGDAQVRANQVAHFKEWREFHYRYELAAPAAGIGVYLLAAALLWLATPRASARKSST